MTDIFLSYSRRDQDFVRQLHDSLISDGRDVWVDWESIPLTADWFEEIKAGIEGADAFLFIISPDSVRSEVCAAEIEHALNMNKRFVPLLYRELIEPHDKAALHPKISSHNWTFMRTEDEFKQNLILLTDALDTDLDHARIHTRILTRALEWEHRGRDTSFVLRGNDLKEAENWLKHADDKEPEVNEIQVEYIQASQVAERWRKRERALMFGITVGIIVAILSAVIAVFQAVEAQNQRDEAQAQRAEAIRQRERAQLLSLAANSQVALTNNYTDLAIALALASNEGDNEQRSGETERALADAAYSPGTVRRFTSHEFDVYAVAFSPDGTMAVSGDSSGALIMWSVETGEELQRFVGHTYPVNSIDIDTDQRFVVSAGCAESTTTTNSGCVRGEIILWDIETSEEIRRFDGHVNDVTSVEFDPTGERLLSGSVDRTMRLWDVETGEELGIYRRHLGRVVDVAFHPIDPNLAVSMAIDTPPTLWNLETAREVIRYYAHDVLGEPNLEVGSVAFSPDGTRILGSFGIPMRVWDTQTGELIREFLGHGSYVNSVAFSSDGTQALSSAWRETSFRVWDIESGVELRRFEGHGDVVRAVTMSLDNRYALSASEDKTVRVWDLANGAEVLGLSGHTDDIYSAVYSPNIEDGYIVATGGQDEYIRIWDIDNRQEIVALELPEDVWTVAFTPDGSKLVSGGEDNVAHVWDMETFEEIALMGPHDDWVTTVTVSPDGTQVLTGSNDQKVRLWNIETGRLIREYAGDDGQLRSVVYTPDGTKFISGANTARLIDIATGEVLQEYVGHASRINSVALSSDGSLLATGSADATIRLWETETGKLLTVFVGHSSQVRSVMFNHDDTTILSSAADATIRLWSVNGLELRILVGHDEWVNQAAFSPDGKFAVSGAWDDTLKIWHIHTVEELIEWANENRFIRELTCNEERIYRLSAQECDS